MLLVTILPASYRMFVPVANQVESNSWRTAHPLPSVMRTLATGSASRCRCHLPGSLPFGECFEPPQLLAHHDQIPPRQQRTTDPLPPPRGSGIQFHHQSTGAFACGSHSIRDRQRPEQALELRPDERRDVPIQLEVNDLANQKALPTLQMFSSRRQRTRTVASVVIDPVVAVGRELELAQPAKKHLRRCRNVNRAQQSFVGYSEIVIAGVAGRAFIRCGIPELGRLSRSRIRNQTPSNKQIRTLVRDG